MFTMSARGGGRMAVDTKNPPTLMGVKGQKYRTPEATLVFISSDFMRAVGGQTIACDVRPVRRQICA